MLKFLRKYNKIILVVGGSMLMVVFLIGGSLQQLTGPGDRKLMRLDGVTVRQSGWQEINDERTIVATFLQGLDPMLLKLEGRSPAEGTLHYYMLAREAEDAGFVGGPRDGADFINDAAELITRVQLAQLGSQLTPQMISSFEDNTRARLQTTLDALIARFGPERVGRALARARGIVRMHEAYEGAARLSETDAVTIARDFLDVAETDSVILDIDESLFFLADEPTEEAIQEQFDKYNDVEPLQGEHGFGYRRSSMARVEWIEVDRQAVIDAIELDPVEVFKRFQGDRNLYPREFNVERERVEQALREEQADERMRKVDQVIRGLALEDARSLPTVGRFKEIPPDWQGRFKSLAEIAEAVAVREGIEVNVNDQERLVLKTRTLLRDLPGIGQSTYPLGAGVVGFDELIFQLREVLEDDAQARIQVGELYGPATGPGGNKYYFRFVGARPEGPPESVDAIRPELVTDLKRLQVFERLVEDADAYRNDMVRQGLDAVVAQFPNAVKQPRVVTRKDFTRPLLSDDETIYRETITDAARKLDPTQAITDYPAEDRMLVVVLPDSLQLAFVELLGRRPLTDSQFRDLAGQINTVLRFGADPLADPSPFSLEEMKRRHDFALVDPEFLGNDEDEETSEESDGNDDDTASENEDEQA